MKTLKLVQGSDEWLEARLDHYTASEASAMMGDSTFMSRNQLLALKKGWKSNPNDSFKEELFRKGHEYEAAAREIVELAECDEFPAVVGSVKIGGLELLASFDGLRKGSRNVSGKKGFSALPWEHKSWNEILAENVRNGILTAEHWWQLEHQMVVCGSEQLLFTVSNGTESKLISMIYTSVPERRQALIDSWVQFDKDLAEFEIEARQELVEAKRVEDFPILEFSLNGTAISSNIQDVLDTVRSRAQFEMTRVLETDEDFAEKDEINKKVKDARTNLKAAVQSAENQFGSFADFKAFAVELDKVLQKMQSDGEGKVLAAKNNKRIQIKNDARRKLELHIVGINVQVQPVDFNNVIPANAEADFDGVMKGKRSITALKNAVDQENARVMIILNDLRETILKNLALLLEHASDYNFLFADTQSLAIKDPEAVVAIIKQRITDHQQEVKDIAERKAEEERVAQELAEIKAQADDDAEARFESLMSDIPEEAFGEAPEVLGVDIASGPDLSVDMVMDADGNLIIPDHLRRTEGAPVNQEQVSLATKLKFWVFDFSVPNKTGRALLEILNKYGHPDLTEDDIL